MKKSISRKILFGVVIASAVITIFITAFQMHEEYKSQIDIKYGQFDTLMHVNGKALETSLWDLNGHQIDSILEGYLAHPSVTYLELTYESVDGESHKKLGKVSSEALEKAYDLSVEGNEVGRIVFYSSKDQIYKFLINDLVKILFINALKTFLASFLILLVVNQLLTKHLLSISNFIRLAESGEADGSLSLNRIGGDKYNDDELTQLVSSINGYISKNKELRLLEVNKIVSATPACMKIIDSTGALLHMNDAGLKMIEASSLDSVKGVCLYDVVEDSYRKQFKQMNESVCKGETQRLEFEIIGLKGTRRWMETYAAPYELPNGELGHISITNDISEKVDTKQKLSLFYQHSPFGFAFCDIDGNILDVNKKYEEIVGYSLEELMKLSYWDITPKKYEKDEAKQLESIEKTGKYGPYRKEYRTKSGGLVPVELNGFVVKDYQGMEGIWSIIEDISEEIEQEKHFAKQKSIAQHNAKLASIGELAAGVGHEINNPLAIAKGYLDLIERKELVPEALKNNIKKINFAMDRIGQITQGLRTFSRSDSNELSEFSPVTAIEESFHMIHEIYKRDGIQVKFVNNVENNLILLGNRGELQQIMMNLISNAKDSTEEKSERRIDVDLSEKDKSIIIKVKDNGCGMSESLQKKIFDPFFTTKDVNKGTGIGLSLVHTFVKEMKGTLLVDSIENEGTTFVIQFPVLVQGQVQNQGVAEPVVDAELQSEAASLKFKVMLVDDEEGIRELLSDILEEMGFEVSSVDNGLTAFNLYLDKPEKFDLIISDMKMPGMDGPTLLRKIRSENGIRQPKFIFITGGINIDFEDKNNDLNKLIDGYFFKPFDEKNIFEVLSECLPNKQNNKVS